MAGDQPPTRALYERHELPDWIHPFERFAGQLVAHGAPCDDPPRNPERCMAGIGELLEANLPIGRHVSAWVADLDRA
jgi:hypothetical protein